MGSTGRHRRVRPRGLPRLGDLGKGRYGLAAVCGVAVVSLLASSQPVWTVELRAPGPATAVAPHDATTPLVPDSFLTPTVLRAAAAQTLPSTTTAGDDIPGPALAAYQRAASVMAEAAPGCELSWTLLAAVGRVESDHGRYGGAVLGADGVSRPHIVGAALDGTGQVAEIRDTDDGRLDGDRTWDRAVGPMQFLPTTWALAGVDGDGDGARNPHDLNDAALAAGVYLCAGGGDLSQEQDVRAALLRYNPSTSYVALVMGYEEAYRTGHFRTDSGPALTSQVPEGQRTSAAAALGARTGRVVRTPAPATVQAARAAGGRADQAAPVSAARPAPAAKSAEVELAAEPEPATPAPATPAPATPASATPAPAGTQPVAGAPAQLATPVPAAGPAPEPEGEPAPDSEPPGDAEQATPPPPSPGPDPVPDTPLAPDPEETDPTAAPADVTQTERVTVTGMLTTCDAWFCLDEQPLLPGDPAALGQPAESDLDGDGEVETYLAELTGLVGRNVVVLVDKQENGWLVYAIHELVEALAP